MNKLILAGSLVVVVALVFYTIAFFKEVKKHQVTKPLLFYFSVGLMFDIVATCFMITGSPHSPFTLHGFIGYSALTAMTIEVFLLWRLYLKGGNELPIPSAIQTYTMFAYFWWVLAFITGGLIASLK